MQTEDGDSSDGELIMLEILDSSKKTILKELLDEDNGLQIKVQECPFPLFQINNINDSRVMHVK